MADLKLLLNGQSQIDIDMGSDPLTHEQAQVLMDEIKSYPALKQLLSSIAQSGFNAGKKAACDAMMDVIEKKTQGGALWNCQAAN